MAELLSDGLWWLHGTRGSNVYLVEADDGQLALVDTGFGSSADAIAREVEQAGGGRKLSAILLTHMHADHSGAAGALRTATGARVVAGKGDCIVRSGRHYLRPMVGRTHLARFLLKRLSGSHTTPIRVDTPVDGETEILPGIRAIPVQGHTPGSLCFIVDRLGAAFVGDLVISHNGRLTRSMRAANRDDALYLRTLADFAKQAPASGLPGHGLPVMEGFGDALRDLATRRRRKPSLSRVIERARRMTSFLRGLLGERRATGG